MHFSNFLLGLPNNVICDLNVMASFSKASMSFSKRAKQIKSYTCRKIKIQTCEQIQGL